MCGLEHNEECHPAQGNKWVVHVAGVLWIKILLLFRNQSCCCCGQGLDLQAPEGAGVVSQDGGCMCRLWLRQHMWFWKREGHAGSTRPLAAPLQHLPV